MFLGSIFDFSGLWNFIKEDSKMFGISVVIFVVLFIGVLLFIRWRSRRDKMKEADAGTAPESKDTAPVAASPINSTIAPVSEVLYECTCGVKLTQNEFTKHLMKMGKQEKGEHKSLGKVDNKKVEVTGVRLNTGAREKYKAIIFRYAGDGQESVIEFKTRISQPCGTVWYSEPSLPINGECYCVKELADGTFLPYDPRKSIFAAKETPTQAYMATHWDRAEGVWLYIQSNMQKISLFVIVGLISLTGIVVLVKIAG
jgi:hypothetical protein